jgi:hypothetical protein
MFTVSNGLPIHEERGMALAYLPKALGYPGIAG